MKYTNEEEFIDFIKNNYGNGTWVELYKRTICNDKSLTVSLYSALSTNRRMYQGNGK